MKIGNSDEHISADVLVLGGGLAGCFAAIKAAEEGVKVALFEKADIRRSGNGATGLHRIPLIHPDYNLSYEEFARLNVEGAAGICDEDISHEFAKDTLDRVLDLESYGVKLRKDDGSFIFKPAADIAPGNVVIWPPGPSLWHDVKPKLAQKVQSFPNVTVLNRTTAIGLLTRDDAVGSEIVGAVGLGTRSGKFVICKAKAVVLTSGGSYRLGRHKNSMYAPTRFIECGCPTCCGDGQAMAYRAGADLVNMEFANHGRIWKDFSHWGGGPAFAVATPVGGKGQSLKAPPGVPDNYSIYKRTYNYGFESEGPLYYDASRIVGYPVEKADMQLFLWALENESTSPGYLLWMRERGEDFAKAPVEFEWHPPYVHDCQGGVHIDIDAKSALDGLYCAGDVIGGGWRQSSGGAFVFGARAGRGAAEYAKKAPQPPINVRQVNREKSRILKALAVNPRDGYGWVDLEDKVRMIASEYGPPFTSDAKLERGLMHLERIKARYLPKLYARDPREMLRVSEVKSVFFIAEVFLRCALFRKETRHPIRSSILYKSDYPERDDASWLKHTLVRNVDGELTLGTKEVKRLDREKGQ